MAQKRFRFLALFFLIKSCNINLKLIIGSNDLKHWILNVLIKFPLYLFKNLSPFLRLRLFRILLSKVISRNFLLRRGQTLKKMSPLIKSSPKLGRKHFCYNFIEGYTSISFLHNLFVFLFVFRHLGWCFLVLEIFKNSFLRPATIFVYESWIGEKTLILMPWTKIQIAIKKLIVLRLL